MADKKKEPISIFGITLGGGGRKKGVPDPAEVERRMKADILRAAEERMLRELVVLLSAKSTLAAAIKMGQTLKKNANEEYAAGFARLFPATPSVAETEEPPNEEELEARAEAEKTAIDRLEKRLLDSTTLGDSAMRRAQEAYSNNTQNARSTIIRILDDEDTASMINFKIPERDSLVKMGVSNVDVLFEHAGKNLLAVAIVSEDIELIEIFSRRLTERKLDAEGMTHLTALAVEDAATAMKTLDPEQRAKRVGPLRRLASYGFDLDAARLADGSEAFNILERVYPFDRVDDFLKGINHGQEVWDAMLFDIQRATQVALDGGLYSQMVTEHALKALKAEIPEGSNGEKFKAFLTGLTDALKDSHGKLTPTRAQALQQHHQRLSGPTLL